MRRDQLLSPAVFFCRAEKSIESCREKAVKKLAFPDGTYIMPGDCTKAAADQLFP